MTSKVLSQQICCIIGICVDIASLKHEYWSSLAPLPFEVVISAGQKAREESWEGQFSLKFSIMQPLVTLRFN